MADRKSSKAELKLAKKEEKERKKEEAKRQKELAKEEKKRRSTRGSQSLPFCQSFPCCFSRHHAYGDLPTLPYNFKIARTVVGGKRAWSGGVGRSRCSGSEDNVETTYLLLLLLVVFAYFFPFLVPRHRWSPSVTSPPSFPTLAAPLAVIINQRQRPVRSPTPHRKQLSDNRQR